MTLYFKDSRAAAGRLGAIGGRRYDVTVRVRFDDGGAAARRRGMGARG